MKQYLLFALAIIAFASCSSDDYVGKQDQNVVNGDNPISFNFDVPVATRATGSEAAGKLSNQFIVYGEKNEPADDASGAGEAPKTDGSAHQLVFQNYVVKYTDNSAYTTTSNTKNWEYVGFTQSYGNNVTPQADETQTIKYWDYSASNYVFTAFSALESELTDGKVKVDKITAKTTDNKNYDKGYTVTLAAAADPTKLYFSDRQVIDKTGAGSDRTAPNQYGGNVTLTFRNATSQVRAAMYETISGYDVKIDNFYYADAAAPAFTAMTTADTNNQFYANVPNVTTEQGATLTVTYYESGVRKNQPKISVSATANNYLALGTNIKTQTKLGESSTEATYDKAAKAYTSVFPQESNTTNLKLKVDYTLKNSKTGETIKVTGATAEVPGQYLAWKPNFKYTYIFKISDNTNGHTGETTDPAGLWPITFDAAVIVAEDGQAEYITTVSEPSITTFGVKGGNYVHDGSEYEAGSDIYATIMDVSSVVDPDGKYNVYTVTTTDATNFPITEASVAESIAEVSAKTHKVTCTAYAGKELVTTVPGEDGNTITLSPGKAIKLSSLAAGTYAIQYAKTAATYNTVEVTYDTQAEFEAALAKMNLFNNSACTQATTAGAWAAGAKFYYKVVDNPGVYAYKVIRVQ